VDALPAKSTSRRAARELYRVLADQPTPAAAAAEDDPDGP
jgi:hypothetical protein